MYVLADGDHVYTLNHDLNRLEQLQDDGNEDEHCVRASSDYKIREEKDIITR